MKASPIAALFVVMLVALSSALVGVPQASAATRFDVFSIAQGELGTYAHAINDDGAVAGFVYEQGPWGRGFVRTAEGAVTIFDVPGATSTFAYGMNNIGDVVGAYFVGSDIYGFFRSADGLTYTTIGPASVRRTQTIVYGIDDNQNIIGTFIPDGGAGTYAFRSKLLGEDFRVVPVSELGRMGGAPTVIPGVTSDAMGFAYNDRRQFVGYFRPSPDAPGQSFIATEVPEPSSWALMIGGFGLAGVALRRRGVVLAEAR